MVYTFSWILRFMYLIHIFDCLLDISAWLFRKMYWAGPNSLDSPSSSPPRSSIHFPGKNTGVGFHFLLQLNLLDWEIETTSPGSPDLGGGFFTTESPGKPGFTIEHLKYLLFCYPISLLQMIFDSHEPSWLPKFGTLKIWNPCDYRN